MFIDDQQPSSGSISVFLITKYTIDSVLSLYHITILLHVTIYITMSIYHGSTSAYYKKIPARKSWLQSVVLSQVVYQELPPAVGQGAA